MNFSSFNGFKELGYVAGTGILCGLFAIYLILPPILVLKSRRKKRKYTPVRLANFHLDWIANRLLLYPRLVFVLTIIVTVYLGYSALSIEFDENVRKLRQPSPEYVALKRKLKQNFPLPGNQVIAVVRAKSTEEALRKNDRLYENIEEAKEYYPVLSCNSLRTYLPSEDTQLNARALLLTLDVEKVQESISKEAIAQGFDIRAFDPFFESLRRLQEFAKEGQLFTFSNVRSPMLRRILTRYMVHSGSYYEVITHIYPYEGSWVYQVPEGFLDLLQEGIGNVEFTGVTILSSALESMAMVDLARVALLALLSVFLITLLHFGNINRTLVASIPIVCGSVWMLGTMALLNIEMNFLNIIVVPMIIGLSVDDGIHLVGRYYELRKYNLYHAVQRTGRAVVLTSLTSMLAFGSLALANYRGIREMGLLAIMGVGYALISSLIVLPAVLKIWGRYFRMSSIFTHKEGE
jgi:predicted RND superfamily exporter protein